MKTLLALALAFSLTSLVGCASPAEETSDEPEISTTSEALTTCSPTISAAAVTRQIVSVGEPVTLTVELITISPKPYRMQSSSMTFPAGFTQQSLATTVCADMGSSWKCRHEGHLLATGATSGTGAYSITFASLADANSGCSNGAAQRVNFSLTTESFGYYTVSGF